MLGVLIASYQTAYQDRHDALLKANAEVKRVRKRQSVLVVYTLLALCKASNTLHNGKQLNSSWRRPRRRSFHFVTAPMALRELEDSEVAEGKKQYDGSSEEEEEVKRWDVSESRETTDESMDDTRHSGDGSSLRGQLSATAWGQQHVPVGGVGNSKKEDRTSLLPMLDVILSLRWPDLEDFFFFRCRLPLKWGLHMHHFHHAFFRDDLQTFVNNIGKAKTCTPALLDEMKSFMLR